MRSIASNLRIAAGAAILAAAPVASVHASSHMDAPLITLDDPANTTDVYAFRSESEDGATQYLTTALAVYPFEEPGIGPNNYRFDDRVLYEIHVSLGDDVGTGEKTISYQFAFDTSYANERTILQAYLGEVEPVSPEIEPVDDRFDANQNLRQTYTLTKIDYRTNAATVLGRGIVPPNNQGLVTPFYNRDDDGERSARKGVADEDKLDGYTRQAIAELDLGYRGFAGQRDDGFYADIQSIFDLDFSFGTDPGLAGTNKPFDSQGGFNLHTIVLNIPLSELDGAPSAGVHATTSRQQVVDGGPEWVQVGRQGNPLFAEALVAIVDKDRYNQSDAIGDETFGLYADYPEISAVLGVDPLVPGLLRQIYIPDVIKVDLTTGPARLAGESDFSRLSAFGGDTFRNGAFGGWPNGRRFGDDVLDIAIIALGGAGTGPFDGLDVDGVRENDITFNDVFPYAATPLNGRVHEHHGDFDNDDDFDDDFDDDDEDVS